MPTVDAIAWLGAADSASAAVLADLLESVLPRTLLDDPVLFQQTLPVIRAEAGMVTNYQYMHAPPLDCPITCLGGVQDQTVPREALQAWQAQTRASFRVVMLPGDHFFLRTHSDAVAELINEAQLRR
jgi:medium-chain acyl-[acyl-carrier-protein] hydrolase